MTPAGRNIAELLLQSLPGREMAQCRGCSFRVVRGHLFNMSAKFNLGGADSVRLAMIIHKQRYELGVKCRRVERCRNGVGKVVSRGRPNRANPHSRFRPHQRAATAQRAHEEAAPNASTGGVRVGAAKEQRYRGSHLSILVFSIHRLNWQRVMETTIILTEASHHWIWVSASAPSSPWLCRTLLNHIESLLITVWNAACRGTTQIREREPQRRVPHARR